MTITSPEKTYTYLVTNANKNDILYIDWCLTDWAMDCQFISRIDFHVLLTIVRCLLSYAVVIRRNVVKAWHK